MPQHLTADYLIHVGETIPITIDYAVELGGDTIQTSTWSVFTGATAASETETTTSATLWLTAGTAARGVVANTTVSGGGQDIEALLCCARHRIISPTNPMLLYIITFGSYGAAFYAVFMALRRLRTGYYRRRWKDVAMAIWVGLWAVYLVVSFAQIIRLGLKGWGEWLGQWLG